MPAASRTSPAPASPSYTARRNALLVACAAGACLGLGACSGSGDSRAGVSGVPQNQTITETAPTPVAFVDENAFNPFSMDAAAFGPDGELIERPETAASTPTGPGMPGELGLFGDRVNTPFPGALPLPSGERGASEFGTGNFRQVSFALEGGDFDPDVSNDGKHLVFASTQHRPTADIYIKAVDGRTVTQLTSDPANDVMPRISPDGQRIAFTSNRSGNWDIFVMPTSGGQAVQITSESSNEVHPSWSPDGAQLVFCRMGETSGKWELWVSDVRNTAVTNFIGYGLFPEWCPTPGTGMTGGDRILFQRSRERGERSFAIWSIEYKNGQATNPTEMASSPSAACINPSWSQDGQWFVFATVPSTGARAKHPRARPESSALWLMNVDGTDRVNLSAGKFTNLMPTWGPGNQLYFVSDRGGVDNIWSVSTSEAILAATGRTPGGAGAPAAHASPNHAAPMAHADQPAPAEDASETANAGEGGH